MTEDQILKRITYLRKYNRITQKKISEETGLALRTYQRIETGENSVKLDVLLKILNYLDPNFEKYFASYFEYEIDPSVSSRNIKNIESINSKRLDKPIAHKTVEEVEILKQILNFKQSDSQDFVGYWELNLTTQEAFLSDDIFEIYGLKKTKDINFDQFSTNLSSSDAENLKNSLKKLIEQNVPYQLNYTIDKGRVKTKVKSSARRLEIDDDMILFGIIEVVD